MSDIYGSNSDFAFNKLFQLRLERAKKAGLDVSNIPPFEKGGDYALAELLEKEGLPETKGKNEFSWLRQGMESSTASAAIKF